MNIAILGAGSLGMARALEAMGRRPDQRRARYAREARSAHAAGD